MRTFLWPHLKQIFWRRSVISVFLLVVVWNVFIVFIDSEIAEKFAQGPGFWRETFSDLRELNTHLQLRFYQILSSLRPIPFEPKSVSMVLIDDTTHWHTLYGDEPTDRAFLAKLVRNASEATTKAKVIGLDIGLYAPRGYPAGSDKPERAKGNYDLLDAIKSATQHGVAIVIATTFDDRQRRRRLPNIYKDSELPLKGADGTCQFSACATLGYINAPADRRHIPLTEQLFNWDNSGPQRFESFAFALVNAYEEPYKTTRQNPVIAQAIRRQIPVLGSFVKESAFKDKEFFISAQKLAEGDREAKQRCSGRIVLIGGFWHSNQGYGRLVDGHLSPVGEIAGITFHGNYIESLLSRTFATEFPTWLGILLDLIIGLLIYVAFALSTHRLKLIVLLAAFFLTPVLAYLSLVTANLYLDFLLPTELYVLHILYEYVSEILYPETFINPL
jgi:CHASE2 domain-containing sensor protein